MSRGGANAAPDAPQERQVPRSVLPAKPGAAASDAPAGDLPVIPMPAERAPAPEVPAAEGGREAWLAAQGAGRLRDVDFDTLSSVPVQPLYTPEDATGLDHERDLGYPGQYAVTRGIYPTMYRGRLWTFRQFSGFGTPAETNARYKFLLAQGQTGLSVAFDMPTLMGRDSDDPVSEGEVGRCGVAVDSVADMEALFEGIPLGDITTSMTISGPAAMVFAMWLVVAERQGVGWRHLGG